MVPDHVAPGYRVTVLATANLLANGIVWWDFQVPFKPYCTSCFTHVSNLNPQARRLLEYKTREEIILIFGNKNSFMPSALLFGKQEVPCFGSIETCRKESA